MAEKHHNIIPYVPVSALRLGATEYFDPFDKRKRHLAQLKTHFSLLTLEDDEVDYLKPKYWYSKPNWLDIVCWIIIIVVFVCFIRFIG